MNEGDKMGCQLHGNGVRHRTRLLYEGNRAIGRTCDCGLVYTLSGKLSGTRPSQAHKDRVAAVDAPKIAATLNMEGE